MDKSKAGRQLIAHSRAARSCGVCTRTVDRWVASGLLPPPIVINNRKYHVVADIERVGGPGRTKAPEALRQEVLRRAARLEREAREETADQRAAEIATA
jgi:predicted site-specific integrase-resolvase